MFFKTNAPEVVQAITDFFAKKSELHAEEILGSEYEQASAAFKQALSTK